MILYLTKDLMMASNIRSVAQNQQIELVIVPSVEKLTQRLSEDGDACKKVIVDLQTPGLTAADFDTIIQHSDQGSLNTARPVVGYAQHVYVDLIDAAKTAGFSHVYTRGQINGNVAAILNQ
jgi:hypothetical protein